MVAVFNRDKSCRKRDPPAHFLILDLKTGRYRDLMDTTLNYAFIVSLSPPPLGTTVTARFELIHSGPPHQPTRGLSTPHR